MRITPAGARRHALQSAPPEHGKREVAADHPAGRPDEARHLHGQIAGPGAHVERGVAGLQPGLGGGGAAPAVVEARRQERVEQVVARRDGVEHRPDVGVLLVPFRKVGSPPALIVGHVDRHHLRLPSFRSRPRLCKASQAAA
jgi:hypothetical protein